MITSVANPQVKQVCGYVQKAKERRKDRIYVVEGPRMFEEAPPYSVRKVYVTEEFLARYGRQNTRENQGIHEWEQKQAKGREADGQRQENAPQEISDDRVRNIAGKLTSVGYEVVSPQVMEKMSDTSSSQGILALMSWPEYDWEQLLARPDGIYVVLEDLQDPGNLGTIFRTAEGAGVAGVILTGGTADLFNPKTVRSTMGSIYRIPFLYEASAQAAIERLKGRGIAVYAAHLAGTKTYDQFDYTKGCAFLIGNEGNGLRQETASLADSYLRIPMAGKLESLNAAVAAALLMYEAARQWHFGKKV